MKKTAKIIILAIIALTTCSCMKSKLETIYNKQEDQIDKYLSSKTDLVVVRNGGANRMIVVEGEGEELKSNGLVSFYYAGYTFKGSISTENLFITNHQATAEQAGWNLTEADYGVLELDLGKSDLITGLKDGLVGVKAGEECEILFSGKYGFGNDTFGIIPANSALLYKIWVIGVTND